MIPGFETLTLTFCKLTLWEPTVSCKQARLFPILTSSTCMSFTPSGYDFKGVTSPKHRQLPRKWHAVGSPRSVSGRPRARHPPLHKALTHDIIWESGMYIYIYICIYYIYTYVCMYVCMHVCMYVCIYIYIYIYLFIYTHIIKVWRSVSGRPRGAPSACRRPGPHGAHFLP